MKNKILILGASGQDGKILSNVALRRGYLVYGAVRLIPQIDYSYEYLKLQDINYVTISDYTVSKLSDLLEQIEPDYVVNFISQSSVGLSFREPFETFDSVVTVNSMVLEALRIYKKHVCYFYASSGECFGSRVDTTNLNILASGTSPYAFSKRIAVEHIRYYRDKYQLNAKIGFFFNHESEFRPDHFVVPKIINGVLKIRNQELESLELGNLDVVRDWALAEDYMVGLLKFIESDYNNDVEFATGVGLSIKNIVAYIFEYYNLNASDYLVVSDDFTRPDELKVNIGNPEHLRRACNWYPRYYGLDVIHELICRNEKFNRWKSAHSVL